MKFFFDTEFIEDGRTIDLISIGIVAEDGREYYAESGECDLSRSSEWVRENVFPHLRGGGVSREQIARDIIAFVGSEKPEFWAYYADYDWVALCQLYGRMIDLPHGWPRYCRDLKQLVDSVGADVYCDAGHDALADAAWVRRTWMGLR
jgi:hypothetical protein